MNQITKGFARSTQKLDAGIMAKGITWWYCLGRTSRTRLVGQLMVAGMETFFVATNVKLKLKPRNPSGNYVGGVGSLFFVSDFSFWKSRIMLTEWSCLNFNHRNIVVHKGDTIRVGTLRHHLQRLPAEIHKTRSKNPSNPIITHIIIHVWYIYLHLVDVYGKCRQMG